MRHLFDGNTIERVIIYTNEFHEWILIYIIDNDCYEITRMFDYELQQSSYYDYKNLAKDVVSSKSLHKNDIITK